MRSYCENALKNRQNTYLSGDTPLRKTLDQNDIHTFVIDDQFLILIFQPYVVGGSKDGPFVIKIPHEHLNGQLNSASPLPSLLQKTIASQSYTSSWNEKEFFQNLLNNH